jgi:signal transduction histidine kinase
MASGKDTADVSALREELTVLEDRIAAAEARASEAEERVRELERRAEDETSSYRHTLGERTAGRKSGTSAPSERPEPQRDPEEELRRAIARGFRGPLTRAAGLTLSLQRALETNDGKSVARQLSASLRRLDQLAADLHDVRRIADGTLPLQRRKTDVASLLQQVVDESEHLLEDRLVRLDTDAVQASVDPVRLRQIVEGMLEASRERTRPGAAIVLRARTTDRGFMIAVEDDTKAAATVGPELTLAARLTELHGGQLVADGSVYRVVVPDAG